MKSRDVFQTRCRVNRQDVIHKREMMMLLLTESVAEWYRFIVIFILLYMCKGVVGLFTNLDSFNTRAYWYFGDERDTKFNCFNKFTN